MRTLRRILARLRRPQTRRAIACVAVTLTLVMTLWVWKRSWLNAGIAFVCIGKSDQTTTIYGFSSIWYANIAWVNGSIYVGGCKFPNTPTMRQFISVEDQRSFWGDVKLHSRRTKNTSMCCEDRKPGGSRPCAAFGDAWM